MNEDLKFYLYIFRAKVIWEISNIVIMLLKNIKKERVEIVAISDLLDHNNGNFRLDDTISLTFESVLRWKVGETKNKKQLEKARKEIF